MVRMKKPDWKCVFTYVQSFYRRFRNGRDPPTTHQRSKTIALGAHEVSQLTKALSAERRIQVSHIEVHETHDTQTMSPEQQKHLLSKYFLDEDQESNTNKGGGMKCFFMCWLVLIRPSHYDCDFTHLH